MTDVWFYHLQKQPLERVLPTLVERTLARGWNAVIQATTEARLASLDDLLWTYDENAFITHGSARDGGVHERDRARQQVWLTLGADNPNNAAVRFFVEGADALPILNDPAAAPMERAIILFDGRDEAAVVQARMTFRTLRDGGHTLSYWKQSDDGRWEKAA